MVYKVTLMFFILSKIVWAFISPLTLITLICAVGLILRKQRVVTAGVCLFLFFGVLPVGPNLVVYLEGRYAIPEPLPKELAGIIVLGGAVDAERSAQSGQLSIGDYGERLTEMIRLSRIYPDVPIIYSGGDAGLTKSSTKESTEVQKYLKNIDLDDPRIVFEDRSRNTYENMSFSTELANPQAGDKWLLITSAFHMPRSVAVFEKGGWDVIPYPAGYLENSQYFLLRDLDVLGNFYKLQVAMKEIVGIIAYSFTGKL